MHLRCIEDSLWSKPPLEVVRDALWPRWIKVWIYLVRLLHTQQLVVDDNRTPQFKICYCRQPLSSKHMKQSPWYWRHLWTRPIAKKEANTMTQLCGRLLTSSSILVLLQIFVLCFFGQEEDVTWASRSDRVSMGSLWTLETHINTRCKCNQDKILSRYIVDRINIVVPGVNWV